MQPIGQQKFKVTLEFEIEADVYEGDPTDVYELADLEHNGLHADVESLHPGIDYDTVELLVKPILK